GRRVLELVVAVGPPQPIDRLLLHSAEGELRGGRGDTRAWGRRTGGRTPRGGRRGRSGGWPGLARRGAVQGGGRLVQVRDPGFRQVADAGPGIGRGALGGLLGTLGAGVGGRVALGSPGPGIGRACVPGRAGSDVRGALAALVDAARDGAQRPAFQFDRVHSWSVPFRRPRRPRTKKGGDREGVRPLTA